MENYANPLKHKKKNESDRIPVMSLRDVHGRVRPLESSRLEAGNWGAGNW